MNPKLELLIFIVSLFCAFMLGFSHGAASQRGADEMRRQIEKEKEEEHRTKQNVH